jgi:hypothetical protein
MLSYHQAVTPLTDWGFDMEIKTGDEDREKLRQHFLTLSDEQQVKGWDDM